MSRRPREDNVIYANFNAKTRVGSAEETGGPQSDLPAPPGYSEPAMRIYNAAVRQTDVGRAKRGREYADSGRVVDLTPRENFVSANVIGSQNAPFKVVMGLPRRGRQELNYTASLIARTPAERIRAGEFPENTLGVLLIESPDEVSFSCTCPDGAWVCKHSVAVAMRTAALIDADPTVILTMRGMTLQSLEDRRRQEATDRARENSAPGSEYFWSGHELPTLPNPKRAPMIEDSDLDLLHKAMQSVSFTNIDQLRAVSDIEDLYDALTQE